MMNPEIIVNQSDEVAKKNVQVVLALYQDMLNDKKPREAVLKYLTPAYKQHNPLIPTTAHGLGEFFNSVHEHFPNVHIDVHRVIAIGNQVWTHSVFYGMRDDEGKERGTVAADMYILNDDHKITEHWDVLQPIPDPANAANINGII